MARDYTAGPDPANLPFTANSAHIATGYRDR